jgi:predicted acylesterase/phospholipase RssA
MLQIKSAQKPRRHKERARIGLAVAGGGPIGGMYELGALRALDEAIEGLELGALDVYVGVSSGAFVAAGLANGLDTAEMCRIFVTGESDQATFRPEAFLRPAFYEYARRAAGVPRMLWRWAGDLVRNPFDLRASDALLRLGSLLPTGLFDNAAIERFLRDLLTSHGRSNDFRTLASKLYVVAVELESGEAVRFGDEAHDHVPISRAIEASAALPGLYPPVEIEGRYYVDGALRRTLHASVALDAGADLVFGINPLVPFDAVRAQANGKQLPETLLEGGLPAVLSQTFRTLLQSRVETGVSRYAERYRNADLALFEPNPDDVEMFFTNVFSYSQRKRLAEHAYQATREDLRLKRDELGALLGRHGLSLREDVLDDHERSLLTSLQRPRGRTAATATLDGALADLGDALQPPRRRARKTASKRRTVSSASTR